MGDRRTSLKVSLVDYKPDSESAWEIVEFYSEGYSMAPDLSFEEASTKRCVRGESINLEHWIRASSQPLADTPALLVS